MLRKATGPVMGEPADEWRTGTLNVIVRNLGAVPATSVELDLLLPEWLDQLPPESNCPEQERMDGMRRYRCLVLDLAPGQSRTISLNYKAPISADSLPTGQAAVIAYGQAMIFGTGVGVDARPGDESAAIRITRS